MGTDEKKKIALNLFLNWFFVLIIIPVVFNLFGGGAYKNNLYGLGLIDYCFGEPQSNDDFVEFLNIGQGDCTIIKSGNSTVLIDFGIQYDDNKIYTSLLKYGIKSIDLAVITHHHNDHMGGFLKLAEKMEIKRLLVNNSTAEDGEERLYQNIVTSADKNSIELILPKAGICFEFGNAVLKILTCNFSAVEENNRSIIMLLNIFEKNILFTGDADTEVEKDVLENYIINCDIFKIGHHGSASSSNSEFLDAIRPEFAVISCGYDNLYGHPSEDVLQRAEEQGIKILRTDLDRNVRVSFEGEDEKYIITTERGEAYDSIG